MAWFKDDKKILHLRLLNTRVFKEEWKLFLSKARDYVSRFRFFAYYYEKSMERWLKEVSTLGDEDSEEDSQSYDEQEEEEEVSEETDEERKDRRRERRKQRLYANMSNDDYESEIYKRIDKKMLNILPFRIVELPLVVEDAYGEFVQIEHLVTRKKKLVFECNDDKMNARYNFRVIDAGASFLPMNDHNNPLVALAKGTRRNHYIPFSPYLKIYMDYSLIQEATVTLFDVNSMLAYPEFVPICRPLPDSNLTDVAEDTLYGMDSFADVTQANSVEKQNFAMANANSHLRSFSLKETIRQIDAKSRHEDRRNLIDERKKQFKRPYATEGTRQALPDNISLTNMNIPSTAVNLFAMIHKWEGDICTVEGLPSVFYKPHIDHSALGSLESGSAGGGSSKGNRLQAGAMEASRMDVYQRVLEDEVVKQQASFDQYFKQVYYDTFHQLDKNLPEIQKAYSQVEWRMQFNNRTVKSDMAIGTAVALYEAGLMDGRHVRDLAHRNYGITDADDLTEDDILQRRQKRVQSLNTFDSKSEQKKRESKKISKKPQSIASEK